MVRKRFPDEDVIRLLRQIEVETASASGASVAEACRSAGVSDATYYAWRKKYGGMGPAKVKQMKECNSIRPHQSFNMRPPVPETLYQTSTQ